MAIAVYLGTIREDVLAHWSTEIQNDPYGILENDISINYSCDSYSLFNCARKHLHDEINIDWGSDAYKGTKSEIYSFLKEIGYSGIDELIIEPDKEYGIVIMELICNSY